jgi:membrane associated rhomboid family serine protease
VLALAAFVAVELRVENPTVDLSLFRNGPYFGASAAAFALVGSYWVVMFFEPQYLQNILGYSAAEAGLLILPITAPIVLLSPVVHRMIAAHGAHAVMTSGMALGFAGLLVMSRIDAERPATESSSQAFCCSGSEPRSSTRRCRRRRWRRCPTRRPESRRVCWR